MNVIQSAVKWKYAVVHLYDQVMFYTMDRSRIDHTRSVLRLLDNTVVTLKLKKTAFFTQVRENWGHVIKLRKLKVENYKAGAIGKLQVLTNMNDMRSFLGLFNEYGGLVPSLETIALPLLKWLWMLQSKEHRPLANKNYVRWKHFRGSSFLRPYWPSWREMDSIPCIFKSIKNR